MGKVKEPIVKVGDLFKDSKTEYIVTEIQGSKLFLKMNKKYGRYIKENEFSVIYTDMVRWGYNHIPKKQQSLRERINAWKNAKKNS